MSKEEEQLLAAIAAMAAHYLQRLGGNLEHDFMGAGERAVAALVKYGLVEPTHVGGTWTDAGRDFLDTHYYLRIPPNADR
jgi:hypothetical protein